MKRSELEALINLNGFSIIYLQESIPMEFVEDYIEFLDLPYLFYTGYLTHEFIDKYRCELEEFIGDGGVQAYLNLKEYANKYFKEKLIIKNYGLPKISSQNISNRGVKLRLDYIDYEITFSINNNKITIYFELYRNPSSLHLSDKPLSTNTQISYDDLSEDTFIQAINTTLIESKWGLYFDF